MKKALLICDVWKGHWCKALAARARALAPKIDTFAHDMRDLGTQIVHCPSETVDLYYSGWPQRKRMNAIPYSDPIVSEEPREFLSPLNTYETNGCPCDPKCTFQTEFIYRQHDAIHIHEDDLIADSGQVVFNFIRHEKIELVYFVGMALNMCILGRPFGVVACKEQSVRATVVGDMVEIAYSSAEKPYLPYDEALERMLGNVAVRWCPVVHSQDLLGANT